MGHKLFKNAQIINEGKQFQGDLLVKDGHIERIDSTINTSFAVEEINAEDFLLMPGVIDDQVHFREPGYTHKACIASESRAAVAGGTTSFMEMPNTNPTTTNQERLEEKYQVASKVSPANYSFYMGGANDNYDEVMRTNLRQVCGLKLFMGSSTGNMLVDDPGTLESYFKAFPGLIATHCEDEGTVRKNREEAFRDGKAVDVDQHPIIRNYEACYLSSSKAASLAKQYGTRLHILHLTTADELDLFTNAIPRTEKHLTAEVCVHHLTFCDEDYARLGTQIQCNPAVKSSADRQALWQALHDGRLDVIATDHAPHTWEEKQLPYGQAPSGLPLIQHSLLLMLDHVKEGKLSLEMMVDKMCHAPADLYHVENRGYLREGYFADLVLVDPKSNYRVDKANILHQCNWSPFEQHSFSSSVVATYVNGHCVYSRGVVDDSIKGMRLTFNHG